jgi:hypothetical protein
MEKVAGWQVVISVCPFAPLRLYDFLPLLPGE